MINVTPISGVKKLIIIDVIYLFRYKITAIIVAKISILAKIGQERNYYYSYGITFLSEEVFLKAVAYKDGGQRLFLSGILANISQFVFD